MKLLNDLYVYPWMSFQENNCNTVFIDGEVPLMVDPGHMHLFRHVIEGMARDGKSVDSVKCVLCTHAHPDHIEAIDRFEANVISGIGKIEYEYLNNGGKELFLASGCQITKTPFKIFLKPGTIKIGDKTFIVFPSPRSLPWVYLSLLGRKRGSHLRRYNILYGCWKNGFTRRKYGRACVQHKNALQAFC